MTVRVRWWWPWRRHRRLRYPNGIPRTHTPEAR